MIVGWNVETHYLGIATHFPSLPRCVIRESVIEVGRGRVGLRAGNEDIDELFNRVLVVDMDPVVQLAVPGLDYRRIVGESIFASSS